MNKPRIIAFYLPQFHPIPENDKWWGKGFTEWNNVVKAKSRFWGHNQPHFPSDLGFYDLRLEETRIAQADLAKQYGVYGFCYYHYWFNGKMLLERPFNDVLSSGKPDFPFCLCWANENWTRRWDGLESEILMKQNYDEYDPELHIKWLSSAFADRRYIKINDRPIFLVYNPSGINNLLDIINKWKKKIKELGYSGIYLCAVKSVHNKLVDSDLMNYGFDAVLNFMPPHYSILPAKKLPSIPRWVLSSFFNKLVKLFNLERKIGKLPVVSVHSYNALVKKIINSPVSDYKTFFCVMPGWDNSPRTKFSVVIQNDDVNNFKKWLMHAFERTKNYPDEEKIVFINAWNEWAEGCYLEPDLRNGRKFLESILYVVDNWRPNL
ncbi:MAG: glycoside hydrolase family 99-like domain-containing protein [Chlorobi bacterium]|nr:glycoside hydrolase family 99-like domain-containing protein [Chlorobiota bacterium]